MIADDKYGCLIVSIVRDDKVDELPYQSSRTDNSVLQPRIPQFVTGGACHTVWMMGIDRQHG